MFTKELMEDIDAFIADTLTKLTPEMYSKRLVDFYNNTNESYKYNSSKSYYINIKNLDTTEDIKQYQLVVSDENDLIAGIGVIQACIYSNIPYSNLKHFLKSQLFLLVEQLQNIK